MYKNAKNHLPFIEDARQLPANTTTFIAAAFLGGKTTRADVSRMCARGEIKAARPAKAWIIPKENLIAYSRGLPQPIEVGPPA